MKWLKSALVILLIAVVVLFSNISSLTAADQADKITYNRYNIVVLTDASGSMKSTDKNGLRFEAIGKFVALLAERGNRMGTVVFNGNIAYKQAISNADGTTVKKGYLENITKIPAQGYTNIGLGLKTSVEMLNKDRNPNLPSIILLLSDGNTDLPTSDEKKVSLEQKADAIQSARDAGYKIYTISLNADGSANSSELAQIANATGGQFREVISAADLDDVFSMYYSLIFSSKLDKGAEVAFPASGVVNGTFEIPTIGVEEVNIVLSGKASDYSLADPSGKTYSRSALAAYTYSSETYNVVKMVKPLAGNWYYKVKGIPGDKIQINIVYNTDLAAGIKISPQKDVYQAGEKVVVNAFLAEAGVATNAKQNSDFTARLSVTDAKGKTVTNDMGAAEDGFEYAFTPPQSGTYELKANISGQGYDVFTDTIQLNFDNTPPKKNHDIEKTVYLWPFSSNKNVIDLSSAANDAQDKTLQYKVESTAFADKDFSLSGNKLTMKNYSLSKGSFTIRAYDSDGAYCTFGVLVKTVNVTMWGLIALGGGALLVLAVLGILLRIALKTPFLGICYAQRFDDEGTYFDEKMKSKSRGRVYLSDFGLDAFGLNNSKCYFQATKERYVNFVADETIYCNGKPGKKFKIDGDGRSYRISKDASGAVGVNIWFVSRIPQSTGGVTASDARW